MKDVIFISHKSQEDNYFSTWLASKLKLLGYNVWLELDELKSGDAFWPEIENAIRNRSRKFLVVVSQAYLQRINDPSAGIFKELSTADRVTDIKNFKSPIKIDDVSEDVFPLQLMGLNSIPFHGNWQTGLEKLLDSFDKEGIQRDENATHDPLNFWLDAFNIKDLVSNESERVFTNWFPIRLPEILYVHKAAAKSKVDLADILFPYLEYSDRHLSFFPASSYPSHIDVHNSVQLSITSIIEEKLVPVDDFLTLHEPRKKIIELLNKILEDFLFQSKLKKYEQSNRIVFYYPNTTEHQKRISLKKLGKTNVAVTGKTKGNRWSFGISFHAILYPFPCFRINSHIIFENQDNLVLDTDEQHTLRRKFGFDWYNRDWLDTLLGIMIKVSTFDEELKIRIPVSAEEILELDAVPFSIEADFGYIEPEKEDKEE